MEQGNRLASTVVSERQIQDEAQSDSGREARVARLLTSQQTETPASGSDPILPAIERHAASREALTAAANEADAPWRVERGLDMSTETMAAAEAACHIAIDAEDAAWAALFSTRATTPAGLVALIRHLQIWAPENAGLGGAPDLGDVFGSLAWDAENLIGAGRGTDWHSPPPGFMASPAIEPTSFANIEQGIRLEANRLLGIALAEQRRRQTMGIEGHSKPWDAEDDARTRKALHLDALAAIACPGSIQVAGIRYVPESQYERAIREHRLIAGGIHHDDGTVTYLDAVGATRRKPTAHWVAFVAMQLDHRVRAEMARQRMGQGDMTGDEIEAHEARMLRELRADAVADLAFRHLRAFNAAEALRTGAEPATPELRSQGDADLLKLAPQWQAASDLYSRVAAECEAVSLASEAGGPGPAPDGAGSEWEAWHRRATEWREQSGVAAAENAMDDARDALNEIEDRIVGLSSATLAGLQVKARVAQRFDDIDVTWPDGLGDGLVRDILAFVEKAPVGRPDLTDPDALTISLLDCWATWGATLPLIVTGDEHVPAYDRAMDRRNELLDAAETLPATHQAIIPKALAVAWVDFVDEHRPKLSRAEHSFTGAIGLDIHAAIMGKPPSALRPTKTAADGPDLVGLFDYGSASLTELLFLRELADLVGSTAYALGWSGRGSPSYRSGNLTSVGRFMVELGDALTEVESAAEQEARRRQPANPDDRETRLAVFADAVIRNDDPDEIAAFAAELSAHAAALREGL